jgi:hypothetical protein
VKFPTVSCCYTPAGMISAARPVALDCAGRVLRFGILGWTHPGCMSLVQSRCAAVLRRIRDCLMPTGKWLRCPPPDDCDVRAYKCGEFIVAANRVDLGFTWRLFRRLHSGEIQRVGLPFNQSPLPAVLDDRDIAQALDWADNEILSFTVR